MDYLAAKEKAQPQQYEFVLHYITNGFNGKEAALSAQYSAKSAVSTACKLLQKPHIMALIDHELEERNKRLKVKADYVAHRAIEIDSLDVLDIIDNDGSVKKVSQWPKAWRTSVSGIEVKEIWEGKGKNREQVGEIIKVRFPDKVKNLELLGNHVDVGAFQKVDININITSTLAERMQKARARQLEASINGQCTTLEDTDTDTASA